MGQVDLFRSRHAGGGVYPAALARPGARAWRHDRGRGRPAARAPVRPVRSELREALTNLILNAVDAMAAGGTLRLATRAEADEEAEDDVDQVERADDPG